MRRYHHVSPAEKSPREALVASLRAYVNRPAELEERFDLVIVDGRARVACALSTLSAGLLRSCDRSRVIIHDWERSQ